MKSILPLMSLVLMLACTSSKKETNIDQSHAFDSLLTLFSEDRFKLMPMEATAAGDNRYNDTLPNDLTAEYRHAVKAFYMTYREKLEGFDRNSITENQKLSYDFLLRECDIQLASLNFKDYLLPLNQFWSTPLLIDRVIAV